MISKFVGKPEDVIIIRRNRPVVIKHAPGKHNQKTHAGDRGGISEGAYIRRFQAGEDDKIFAELKEDQERFMKESLSMAELKAVADYQLEGVYDVINPALRSGNLPPEHERTVRLLDSSLEKSSLTFHTKVYRGISDDTGAFDEIKVGDVIRDKGYVSTSPNPAVAEAFANSTVIQGKPVVLEIDIPRGQPAIAADLATTIMTRKEPIQDDPFFVEISGFTRLNEIVLPRRLKMTVKEVRNEENAKYVKVEITK